MKLAQSLAALLVAASTLASCTSETGEEFARKLFPELRFERVVTSKLRHSGGHGCTFVLVELPADAPLKPPSVVPQYRSGSYARQGAWRPTPLSDMTTLNGRAFCLKATSDKLDGGGIDGYGAEIFTLIHHPDAWISVYGDGEGQILMVYAPAARLAFHLRYGD